MDPIFYYKAIISETMKKRDIMPFIPMSEKPRLSIFFEYFRIIDAARNTDIRALTAPITINDTVI